MINRQYLPALQQERTVYCPQPHDRITRLEVRESGAGAVEVETQALEELGCRGLDHCLLGGTNTRRGGGRRAAAAGGGQ